MHELVIRADRFRRKAAELAATTSRGSGCPVPVSLIGDCQGRPVT